MRRQYLRSVTARKDREPVDAGYSVGLVTTVRRAAPNSTSRNTRHEPEVTAMEAIRSLVQPAAWVAVARRTPRIAAHGQCPLIREWHHRRAIDAAQFDGGLLDEPRAYPLLIAFPPAPTSRQTANT